MNERFARTSLGVGVVGCGRIGTHRARLAAAHPAVEYLALADIDERRARSLADRVGAQAASGDPSAVIQDDRVQTVIVSTPEGDHAAPALEAIRAGKSVLIEKPLATHSADADAIEAAATEHGVTVRVAYSQRFQRNIFLGKQYLDAGKLGRIVGVTSRVYNSRAQAFAILDRAPDVSPVVDVLTYWVDIVGWFLRDDPPVEVYAAGHGTVLRGKTGRDGPDDFTTAIVTYADGVVASFTICYSLPAGFPTLGQGSRTEVIGTEGVLLLDADNRQNIIYSEHGVDHAYVAGHQMNMGYLGTTSSGDWALGQMFGPIADETRAWFDHLATGSSMELADLVEARRALELTLAIEASAASGHPVAMGPRSPGRDRTDA